MFDLYVQKMVRGPQTTTYQLDYVSLEHLCYSKRDIGFCRIIMAVIVSKQEWTEEHLKRCVRCCCLWNYDKPMYGLGGEETGGKFLYSLSSHFVELLFAPRSVMDHGCHSVKANENLDKYVVTRVECQRKSVFVPSSSTISGESSSSKGTTRLRNNHGYP
jgi:hypothetical protein